MNFSSMMAPRRNLFAKIARDYALAPNMPITSL